MLKLFYQILIGLMAIALWLMPQSVWAATDSTELAKAVQAIESLDQMRSELASTLEGQSEEPTQQTMKEVCRPVGMQAIKLSQENGWQVKQIASKYRNPDHGPDNLHSRLALATFEKTPELMGFWDRETINGQSGNRYYRRINVEASCLACHGGKSSRPQFVRENYPQDLAYDFNIGDLRGMYAVFMPDLQQALETPAHNS
ncbi:MAG: DUF3365 domain-containing protein [Thermosynechococcaceae cyanobacterium MS004]|nr:DUF3365 domain-containing protein [Thermosynechococcaceae cyanobacterium MS004]